MMPINSIEWKGKTEIINDNPQFQPAKMMSCRSKMVTCGAGFTFWNYLLKYMACQLPKITSNVKQLTQKLPATVIHPTTIGKIAIQTLRSASEFRIRGITSRGIFTLLDDRTIVFLSRELYRGPLIANIPWVEPILEQITHTSRGKIINGCYLFSDRDLSIDCSHAEIWSAVSAWNPANLPPMLPDDERLIEFLNTLLIDSENELLSSVLAIVTGSDSPSPASVNDCSLEINQLGAALQEGNPENVTQMAHFFAGRGHGLTPSGDDFLLGIVYGLFSLKQRLKPGQFQLIAPISNLVNRRSTLISANLIDCAATGEVDERIAAAFYTLFNPSQPVDDAAAGLSTWGSSSGLDAAAGMCLLLKILRE